MLCAYRARTYVVVYTYVSARTETRTRNLQFTKLAHRQLCYTGLAGRQGIEPMLAGFGDQPDPRPRPISVVLHLLRGVHDPQNEEGPGGYHRPALRVKLSLRGTLRFGRASDPTEVLGLALRDRKTRHRHQVGSCAQIRRGGRGTSAVRCTRFLVRQVQHGEYPCTWYRLNRQEVFLIFLIFLGAIAESRDRIPYTRTGSGRL